MYGCTNEYSAESYGVNSGYISHYESDQIKKFFSKDHIDIISRKISQLMMGVHPDKKTIRVPDSTIQSVMYNVYNNNRWNVRDMTDHVIEIITNQIKDEYGQISVNNSLNVWDTIWDGTQGVRQHAPIKLREKRLPPMQFNVRY